MTNSLVFKYIIKGETAWRKLDISLEEYFDVEKDEKVSFNSVEKYCHLHEYLDYSIEDLLFINVLVQIGANARQLKQTFWNQGNNFSIERIDTGDQAYRELVMSFLIDSEKQIFEITRIVLADEKLYPAYQGFITDNQDGSQSEENLDLELYRNLYKQDNS